MAGEKDFPAILALRKSCLSYLPGYQAILEVADTSEESYLCKASLNGQIVGSGRLDKISETEYKISRIVTTNNIRKNGLGSKIIKHLEEYAIKNRAKTLTLRCRAELASFYQKLGFLVDGTSYTENSQDYFNMKKIVTNS